TTCNGEVSSITDLSAYSSNCTTVELNWAHDPCATHYIVRRKKPADAAGYITLAFAENNSFSDTTVELGTTYIYNVRPTDGTAKRYSNLVEITTDATCIEEQSIADGTYHLQIRHSEKYVSVANNSMKNGGNIAQWDNLDDNSQKWNITKVDDEWYKITSVLNNKSMELHTSSKKKNVRQWGFKGFDWQLWKFEAHEDWYNIISKYNNEVLEVDGGATATNNGANIRVWPSNGQYSQQFKLVATTKLANGEHYNMEEPFAIYPNPASSHITVELLDFEEKAAIEIYNATGQLQVSAVANNSIEQINIESLKQGIYLVRIQNGDSIYAGKIMVK
ncbi:MAG: RICIN domain-containing protein, partial [Bacteroidales bacterium]|nr:RICIN domain-containing protein [Bacteroidales bacterium]